MTSRVLRIAPVFAAFLVLGTACGNAGSGGSGPTHPSTSPANVSDGSANCSSPGAISRPNLRYATTSGVDPDLQSLDLFLPDRAAACPPAPLVVYVHGGGFRAGDKANHLTDKIDLFTKAGFGLASLNYRLVGNAGSGATNGMYPAAEQDVAAAIGYLVDHASELDLDAHRIMLLGHSSGAHLVALVATDGSFLANAGVPRTDVVCAAPLDTTYDIPTQVAAGGTNAAMYRNAFGDDPAVWVQGSPSRNIGVGKGIPPFHIVTRGGAARVAQAQSFGAALRAAGVDADVQVAAGLTHEAVNDAVGQPGESVITPALMTFFHACVTS
jgi:acetyl esterase/lipase